MASLLRPLNYILAQIRYALWRRIFEEEGTAPAPTCGDGSVIVAFDDELMRIDTTGVTNGHVLTKDSGEPYGVKWAAAGGGGGGAPVGAQYLVLTNDGTLTAERAITLTSPYLSATDGGANSTWTLTVGPDLQAVEDISGTGIAVRTAANTWITRTTTAPAAGITITDPAGIAGNIVFALADDLNGLENLSTTGFAERTGTSAWQTVSGVDLVTTYYIHPSFGDASDGNVTLSGNITLTRDMQYDTLDVNGWSIDCDGYRIRCRTLKASAASSIIHHNGATATNRFGAAGASGTHAIGGGGAGGNGSNGVGAGSAGSSRTNSFAPTCFDGGYTYTGTSATSSDGGAGAASGSGHGGGAGGDATGTSVSTATNTMGGAYFLDSFWIQQTGGALQQFGGGGGGGGGSSTAGVTAGGGGGGGGNTHILAHHVHSSVSNLTIQAKGGNGAAASGAGNAGGGGGGGGGSSLFIYGYKDSGLPTFNVSGGTGGAGVGTGATGSSGVAGVSIVYRMGV